MVNDHPKTSYNYPDTLIMETASKHDISPNNVAGLKLESLPTIPAHKIFSKDLSESLLSVHDLTSRGYEVLLSRSSAQILKAKNMPYILRPNSYWIHAAHQYPRGNLQNFKCKIFVTKIWKFNTRCSRIQRNWKNFWKFSKHLNWYYRRQYFGKWCS